MTLNLLWHYDIFHNLCKVCTPSSNIHPSDEILYFKWNIYKRNKWNRLSTSLDYALQLSFTQLVDVDVCQQGFFFLLRWLWVCRIIWNNSLDESAYLHFQCNVYLLVFLNNTSKNYSNVLLSALPYGRTFGRCKFFPIFRFVVTSLIRLQDVCCLGFFHNKIRVKKGFFMIVFWNHSSFV